MDDIDLETLHALQGLTTETDEELLPGLIELFAADSASILERLARLLETGTSRAEVERLAHTLKGSAATLGATALVGAAREVETLARESRLAEARPIVEGMAQWLVPVVERLRDESARLSRAL